MKQKKTEAEKGKGVANTTKRLIKDAERLKKDHDEFMKTGKSKLLDREVKKFLNPKNL